MGAKYITDMFDLPADYDPEKDDTAAELDLFINDPYREDRTKRTLPTPLGIGLNLLETPLKAGAKKTREFFTGPTKGIFGIDHKGVLAAGKFNYKGSPLTQERFADMTLTEKNQAFDDYISQRNSNQIDAYGNPVGDRGGDGGQPILPRYAMAPVPSITDQEPEEQLTELQQMLRDRGDIARRFAADGGIMNEDIIGGEFDFESARQMYGLGKLVKKATRAVKKVASSPIGKAAIAYTLTGGLGNLAQGNTFFKGFTSPGTFLGGAGNIFKSGGLKNILYGVKGVPQLGIDTAGIIGKGGSFSALRGITAASILPLLGIGTGDESEEEAQAILDNTGIDINKLRNDETYRDSVIARRFKAEGGPAEGSKNL